MTGSPTILQPFPAPPGQVRKTLQLIDVARGGDPDEMAESGDLVDLPRLWDPATCPPELRAAIWTWCDQVADWINHHYAWRPTQMIPPCWPDHPHIAAELPTLAVLRWQAQEATTPDFLEEWHRYALPMFLDRLHSRLGESSCRNGKHADWPAEARANAYTKPTAITEREVAIKRDSHPAATRHAAKRT